MFKDVIIFSVRGIKLPSCGKLEKKAKYIDRPIKNLMVYKVKIDTLLSKIKG